MNITPRDPVVDRYDENERRRREETRPKNAGIHSDQLKRAATKANRRRDNQERVAMIRRAARDELRSDEQRRRFREEFDR